MKKTGMEICFKIMSRLKTGLSGRFQPYKKLSPVPSVRLIFMNFQLLTLTASFNEYLIFFN